MLLSPLILLLTLFPFTLFARTVSVPPLPGSPYADTEVSTNIWITRRGEGVSSDVVAVRQLFLGLQILVQ